MAMLKTLVSLNADLASSIALRYACQMANIVGMELQSIHVEEPGAEGQPPGTGWVRRTWEQALLKTGEEEIAQLIEAERSSCPPLPPTKMFIGDREEEIFHELERESYDLFVEGTLYTFSPANFYKKIRSRLYRSSSCPIILVKNLMNLTRVVLLFGLGVDPSSVVGTFLKTFEGAEVDVDLFYYKFPQGGATPLQEEKDPDIILSTARKLLADGGRTSKEYRVIQDAPEKLRDLFKDYGLVVSSVQRIANKKSPLTELLHRIPSPILFAHSKYL
jgi:hypothetical protein